VTAWLQSYNHFQLGVQNTNVESNSYF
jgi:hypothetical protein